MIQGNTQLSLQITPAQGLNYYITNQKRFNEIIRRIIKDGVKKLHVVSDFDGTLTKLYVQNKKVPSLISIVRDNKFLTNGYRDKARKLYEWYHKFETSRHISRKKKKALMHEWWKKHFNLLLDSGLSKSDIEKVSVHPSLQLKSSVKTFFHTLYKYQIPIVIFSSSGIGEAIKIFLKKKNILTNNVIIITNSFLWDSKGIAIKVKEPIIYSANKDESMIHKLPVFQKIIRRKNVLLLGNNPEDASMVHGFSYNNLLKISFYDKKTHHDITPFKNIFDVVLRNSNDFKFINIMIKNICCKKYTLL